MVIRRYFPPERIEVVRYPLFAETLPLGNIHLSSDGELDLMTKLDLVVEYYNTVVATEKRRHGFYLKARLVLHIVTISKNKVYISK